MTIPGLCTETKSAIAVDYLERHPQAAAVAFDILSPDRAQPVRREARRSVAMFIGCGHVLRLSVVKELGGYAEFPGSYGVEEKDLCLRLIDAGYQIVKFDGVHVWHDKSQMARDVPRQHASGVCNDLALTLRRVPLGLVFPLIAWKASRHLSFALTHGLLRPCLQGFQAFAFAAAYLMARGASSAALSSIAQETCSRDRRGIQRVNLKSDRSLSLNMFAEAILMRIPRGAIESGAWLLVYRLAE